jgi:hypothetical protein
MRLLVQAAGKLFGKSYRRCQFWVNPVGHGGRSISLIHATHCKDFLRKVDPTGYDSHDFPFA